MIPFHPLADIFPMIEGAEFSDLVEDIRVNGVRDPITLHGGMVLDGRNRYRALVELRSTGELRGQGWGAYAGEAVGEDDLEPDVGLPWFEAYSVNLCGDPLAYVVSRNLMRRHLTISQRAMLAADLGKLGWGGDRSKTSNEVLTISQRAELARVGHATVERADAVAEHGLPELQDAVRKGTIAVAPAAEIARKDEPAQRQELEQRGILPAGARAIMSSRQEPDVSLDYFPTPPWATRALIERVLPHMGVTMRGGIVEPACGEGHIAEVLREYFRDVYARDVFDYGYGDVEDFLADDNIGGADWFVTNPPFGDKAIQFVLKARRLSRIGVAMFFRSQWAVEGIARYQEIFRAAPPTQCAFFVERVPLCKGRWDPDGSTATAYCWLVWHHGAQPRPPFWIPPGCRQALTRPDDAERFTANPVKKAVRKAELVMSRAPRTSTPEHPGVPAYLKRNADNSIPSERP